ncbi:glucan endo-1,3-beta-glucosidase-like [Impatiens glandulifera]|uniref:glucan endo-1,3-beta-glucosidase-like n=1 Tax=Impatiens glandulifera TaxID=253017 RepID=UPI001FB0EB52|nr:glucan endo-1,3-beta-glucosidase-like [Impatiens glandulifera]
MDAWIYHSTKNQISIPALERMAKPLHVAVVVLLYAAALSHRFSFSLAIGVNYGTTANDLPPPQQVAQFIKDKTLIDRVKIFDANPDIIRAFAGTGILLTITIADGDILNLATPRAARRWVAANVQPFYPATRFHHICVGSEVFQWTDANTIAHLVPAMKAVHNALSRAGIKDVSVTTAHSLIILNPSNFPSGSSFKTAWDRSVIAPMLDFHRRTRSPFMVNPYPYFSWSPQKDAFNLFRRNPGVRDPGTGKTYFNMYDFLLDSVHTSMKKLGYGDVEIAVGEVSGHL